MKKLVIFLLFASTSQFNASEAPKQPQSMGHEMLEKDNRGIQIFDDCSNEECYNCCNNTRRFTTDLIAKLFPCVAEKLAQERKKKLE